MKRVVIPVQLTLAIEEKLMPVLLTMGPETVEFHDDVERGRAVVLHVPHDMPPRWSEQIVRHALRDIGCDLQPGTAITLE